MPVHPGSFDRLVAISPDHQGENIRFVWFHQPRGFTSKFKVLPRDCLAIVMEITVLPVVPGRYSDI